MSFSEGVLSTTPGTTPGKPPDTPLLVACHDAGAANLIFAWLRKWQQSGVLKDGQLLLALQGPAKEIAQASGLAVSAPATALDALPVHVRCLLSGTGWQSDWEHRARLLAKAASVHSIAVLDHWVNYPDRFHRNGSTCLPDQLWVSDVYAERLARQTFSGIPVQCQPNLYLSGEIEKIADADNGDTLYLLEPARTRWGREIEGEFQALDYFIQHRHLMIETSQPRIRLRLHPSEPREKYAAWIEANDSQSVCLDDSATLAESIGRASVVVGMQTAAMVVALAAGRTVYSSLPPWAGTFALPHEGLRQLRQLAADDLRSGKPAP